MSNEMQLTVQPQSVLTIDEIMTLGPILASSGYFSDASQTNQAIVKVLAGRELGIDPVASMTGIHIIKGKPAVGANLMAAAVKANPKYDYRLREHTDKACSIEFYEQGQSIGTSVFTIEDARKAGTQNLDRFPRNMLFARAMSNGVKWFCPDVFRKGITVYTPEELGAAVDEDGDVIDVTPVHVQKDAPKAEAPRPTNGNGKPKAPARPYPATAIRATCRKRAQWFDGDKGPLTKRNVAIGPLDDVQMKKVAALMTAALGQMSAEAKDGARHQALHYLFEQASTKALTHLEAQAIIDWLKGETDFTPGPYAEVELAGVLVQAGVDAGQMEMALDVEPPAQEDAPF